MNQTKVENMKLAPKTPFVQCTSYIGMNALRSQELQDDYDRKIDAHFTEIRLLRERRNADCSKTKNLPSELLSTIFAFLESESRGDPQSHLQWCAVTHVCRSWRSAALHKPTLWIDFTEPHPRWARELFARSQAAPLILYLRRHPTTNLDFIFNHIVEHPERIKTLAVAPKMPFKASLFNKPAPYLETLRLSPNTPVDFTPDFLGGVAPRLKSLTCETSQFPGEARWLANLRTLRWSVHPQASNLANLSVGPSDTTPDTLVNVDDVLSALENMPLLRRLDISLADHKHTVPSTRTALVHLPHLTHITAFICGKATLAQVFSHLSVDNIERLHTSWSRLQDTAAVETVLHFFSRCYHGGDLRHLRQEHHTLELSRSVDSSGAHTPVLTLVCATLDPSRIQELVPRCVPRVFISRFVSADKLILKECGTIEELYVDIFSHLDLEFDGASPPYPSLRRLHLHGLKLSEERVSLLKYWLAERKWKVELVLHCCTISQEFVKSLNQVAAVTRSRT